MPSVQIPPIPFSSVAFFMDIVILLDTPEEGLVLSCERVICYKTSLLQPVPEDSASDIFTGIAFHLVKINQRSEP